MTAPFLSLRDVSFSYSKKKRVLQLIDLDVAPATLLGVIGPNGSGKSTLLQLMTGWLKPDEGTVLIEETPIEKLTKNALAQKIAFVPQREETFFSFIVREAVLFGRYATNVGLRAFESDDDERIAAGAIHAVELNGFENRTVETLSAGERQRMLIARALAQQCPALLLDEPTAALDLHHQRHIMQLLASLTAEQQKTIVVVLHDLNLAAMYCDEIVLMNAGRIAVRGTPEEVLQKQTLEEIYGLPLRLNGAGDSISIMIEK